MRQKEKRVVSADFRVPQKKKTKKSTKREKVRQVPLIALVDTLHERWLILALVKFV